MNMRWMVLVFIGCGLLLATHASAATAAPGGLNISFGQGTGQNSGLVLSVNNSGKPQDLSGTLKIFILFTVITLAPTIMIMCTSFTRIIIVLTFLRQAMGVQHVPPNQVMIAIALFLTAFNMMPVWDEIQTKVVQPYQNGEISWEEVARQGPEPIRIFMLKHTRPKDLSLFLKLANKPRPKDHHEITFITLIPAFLISELKVAFQIGFLLYLPFIVVDMVVASILLSMGMMMLPPIMISLPFKILLFVLIDGWNLIVTSLLKSFQ
ncbi:flagellar type III secretion system pore protein FliP [bacterium]|nr:flagellar type III secretion system pore protein FliP [bacterium]